MPKDDPWYASSQHAGSFCLPSRALKFFIFFAPPRLQFYHHFLCYVWKDYQGAIQGACRAKASSLCQPRTVGKCCKALSWQCCCFGAPLPVRCSCASGVQQALGWFWAGGGWERGTGQRSVGQEVGQPREGMQLGCIQTPVPDIMCGPNSGHAGNSGLCFLYSECRSE